MRAKNPISIEVLETLDAIDRRGSFAKAAEELNKAPSALSYTVQKLEAELSIALFQRQGRRSVLTAAGQLVLEEGRQILTATTRLASRAKEVATGWETHLRIATESILPYGPFFAVLQAFTEQHPSIEVDLRECVLNGGWELLANGSVDLVVGAPGPAPQNQGLRTVELLGNKLVPVIGRNHPMAAQAKDRTVIEAALPTLRRVITHDTSQDDIKRSAGLIDSSQHFYVQTIDQKLHAILAGIGIGHLPKQRAERFLRSGELVALNISPQPVASSYMAWKLDNKGRGLRVLTDQLAAAKW